MLPLCVCILSKSPQLCLILCNTMDSSLSVSFIHGILQARMLEWVGMPSPGDLPDSGIETVSLMFPALAGRVFTFSATWEAHTLTIHCLKKYYCIWKNSFYWGCDGRSDVSWEAKLLSPCKHIKLFQIMNDNLMAVLNSEMDFARKHRETGKGQSLYIS